MGVVNDSSGIHTIIDTNNYIKLVFDIGADNPITSDSYISFGTSSDSWTFGPSSSSVGDDGTFALGLK